MHIGIVQYYVCICYVRTYMYVYVYVYVYVLCIHVCVCISYSGVLEIYGSYSCEAEGVARGQATV